MNVHNFAYGTNYDDPDIVSSFDFDAIIKEMEKDEKEMKAEVAKYHAVQSLLLCEGACPNSDGFEAKIVEMKKDIVNLKDMIETMDYTIEHEMYDQDAFDVLEDENAQLIINNKKLQEKYDNLVCGDNITHIADLTDQIKKLDKDIRHHKLAYRGADEENKKLKKDAEAWAIVRKHLAKDIEEYKKVAKRLTEMSLFVRPSLTDEEIDDLYDKY
tara:strand:+ start:274 stop:915 length:642 start_codon:yes stop_codon:yes gene_type:complete